MLCERNTLLSLVMIGNLSLMIRAADVGSGQSPVAPPTWVTIIRWVSTRPGLSCSRFTNLLTSPTIMASCIKFNLKHLLRSKSKQKQNQDYIYLQWHFMTSTANLDDTQPYDTVSDSIEDKPEVASNRGNTKFSNIHTWLASQPENICAEIYCDCCDTDSDLHYSCVDVSRPTSASSLSSKPTYALAGSTSSLINSTTSLMLKRRQNSISSMISSGSCSNSSSFYEECISPCDEESYYSLQIRQKSKSLFRL